VKVVFLNRFFYPDISPTSQILSDLAFHLAANRPVHVITSRLKYDQTGEQLPGSESIRGVTVHRVWTSRFGRDSLLGRTVDYLTYYLSATLRLFLLVKRGDVVVSMTDPPLISVPASIVARLRGARMVNWLQDIFPEVAGELDFKRLPRLTGNVLAWFRDRSLSTAMCNVVLGDLMAARLTERAIPAAQIRVIHNWSSGDEIKPLAPDRNPLRREWGLDGKFVVGYSGNMGRAHEFAALLGAAERLSGRHDIVFLLIGGGKQRGALEAEVHARGLSNVVFYPYQPREVLAHSLTAPDCHIVSLKPSLEGLIVPSKLYSSLAAGRPVIFLGARDGEISRLMNTSPAFGIRVAPDDVEGLVRAIECLSANPDQSAAFGTTGRQLFERHFDQPIALAKWTSLITELGA
jgi:glycosyltransferase involved in cell wall biosynthesis